MSHPMEGIALSGPPKHPQVRVKTKPTPHARPSVALTGAAVERAWRLVPALALQAGDTVPGVGLLHAVSVDTDYTVTACGGQDNVRVYRGGEPVYAFTAATG